MHASWLPSKQPPTHSSIKLLVHLVNNLNIHKIHRNTTKVNWRKSACVLHAVKVEGLDHSNGVPLSEYGAALAAAAFGAVFLPVLHTIIPLNPCDRRMSLTWYVAIIMGSRIAGAAWFGHLNVNGALLLKVCACISASVADYNYCAPLQFFVALVRRHD